MDAAQYERRHEAVRQLANGALLEFPELHAWGRQKKNKMDFSLTGIVPISDAEDRHFVTFDGLARALAVHYISSLDSAELVSKIAGRERYRDICAPTDYARAVAGLERDIEQRILCSVFDGELRLYSDPEMQEIDTTAAQMRYEAGKSPLPASRADPISDAASQQEVSAAGDDKPLEIGPNTKEAINAYIVRRARKIYAANPAFTAGEIAKLIAGELENNGNRGERGAYLSKGTVEKAIPTGLTGGRGKKGREINRK
jgi:hypothetical protein